MLSTTFCTAARRLEPPSFRSPRTPSGLYEALSRNFGMSTSRAAMVALARRSLASDSISCPHSVRAGRLDRGGVASLISNPAGQAGWRLGSTRAATRCQERLNPVRGNVVESEPDARAGLPFHHPDR